MKKYLLVLLSFLLEIPILSQNPQWEYHFVGNDVSDICTVGDTIYAGTSGGLFIINSNTLESEYINETNSDFKGYDVLSVANGNDEEIWVSVAYEGLNHFDGNKWINYTTNKSNLSPNFFESLIVDQENNVWFHTRNWDQVLTKFDGENFYTFDNVKNVQDIAIDTLKNLWVISGAKLGYLINSELQVIKDYSGSDFYNMPQEIMFDNNNNLLIRKYSRLEIFDGINWVNYSGDHSSIAKDNMGIAYYSVDKSIYKFENNEWNKYEEYDPPLLSNKYEIGDIGEIAFNEKNEIIIGITTAYYDNFDDNPVRFYTTGLSILKEGNWIGFKLSNTDLLPFTFFENNRNIEFDKDNNAYIASPMFGGLINYNKKDWYHYNTYNFIPIAESYSNNPIFDSEGILWLWGSLPSLLSLEDDIFIEHDPQTTCLPTDEYLTSFIIDDYDNKWIGSRFHGLIKYNQTCEQFFIPVDTSLYYETQFHQLWCDNDNNIWVRTETWYLDGSFQRYDLYKFNGKTFEHFNTSNSGLPYDYVNSMLFDKDGTIYFYTKPKPGGCDGKLVKYKDGEWTEFEEFSNGLNISNVKPIAIDSSGNVWGSNCDGVFKFDGNNWIFFDVYNSKLPRNLIYHIEVDNYNNKWFTSYKGLVVYNENGIVNVKEKEPKKIINNIVLNQNYPNPYNPTTTINYSISKQSKVTLKIFDLLGRAIMTLVNKELPHGNYEVEFDASTSSATGTSLSSGIYFYRLQAGNYVKTKKMIFLK